MLVLDVSTVNCVTFRVELDRKIVIIKVLHFPFAPNLKSMLVFLEVSTFFSQAYLSWIVLCGRLLFSNGLL
jgi:hypothetical protein